MKKIWNLTKAQTNNSADLTLYGTIGTEEYWDDIVDKEFKREIDALGDVDEINVYINSPGGDVFAAIAIGNTLKYHKATVTAHIDGLAASAATLITSSCDVVKMPKNAMFMIHNPWTFTYGDRNDLQKTIEELDKAKNSILETYLTKSSLDKEKLSELMDEESWLTAEEAKEYGFVDEVVGDMNTNAKAFQKTLIVNGLAFDISKFKNMPKNIEKICAKDEGKQMKNITIENLEKDYNEIYNEIFNKGVSAERKRMQEIDELEIQGQEEIVKNAKYTTIMNAPDLALKVVKELKIANSKILENIKNESNDTSVGSEPTSNPSPDNESDGFVNSMLKFMNKKIQEVK